MNKYSPWQGPLMSFYSKDFYRDAYKNWLGTGLLYSFVASLILWIIFGVSNYVQALPGLDWCHRFLAQFPTITLKDGNFSIDKPCPFIITDPNNKDRIILLINTTDNTKTAANSPALLVLNKSMLTLQSQESDRNTEQDLNMYVNFGEPSANTATVHMHVKRSGVSTSSHYASAASDSRNTTYSFPIQNCVLTPEIMNKFVDNFVLWFTIAFYAIMTPFFVVFNWLGVLIMAAFAKLFKSEMNFKDAMRLCAVAGTPAMVLSAVCSICKLPLPFLIQWSMTIGYLIFAVKIQKAANQDETTPIIRPMQ